MDVSSSQSWGWQGKMRKRYLSHGYRCRSRSMHTALLSPIHDGCSPMHLPAVSLLYTSQTRRVFLLSSTCGTVVGYAVCRNEIHNFIIYNYHESSKTSTSPPERSQISAIQRRLLNPKHRVLMVNTPIILVTLLLLHPKDAMPGCLMYLTTVLIWFVLLPAVWEVPKLLTLVSSATFHLYLTLNIWNMMLIACPDVGVYSEICDPRIQWYRQ